MESFSLVRVETQVKLILPAELETCLRQRVVPDLRSGVAFRQVGGVGGDLVGDDAVLDIVLVRQTQMLLGRDIAQHRSAVPADHRGADGAGAMIVAWRDVGRERS